MTTMMIIMTAISCDFLPGLIYAKCFVYIMPNCSFISSFDTCLLSNDCVPGSGYVLMKWLDMELLVGETDNQQKRENYLVMVSAMQRIKIE